jgi:hypothetical protein
MFASDVFEGKFLDCYFFGLFILDRESFGDEDMFFHFAGKLFEGKKVIFHVFVIIGMIEFYARDEGIIQI